MFLHKIPIASRYQGPSASAKRLKEKKWVKLEVGQKTHGMLHPRNLTAGNLNKKNPLGSKKKRKLQTHDFFQVTNVSFLGCKPNHSYHSFAKISAWNQADFQGRYNNHGKAMVLREKIWRKHDENKRLQIDWRRTDHFFWLKLYRFFETEKREQCKAVFLLARSTFYNYLHAGGVYFIWVWTSIGVLKLRQTSTPDIQRGSVLSDSLLKLANLCHCSGSQSLRNKPEFLQNHVISFWCNLSHFTSLHFICIFGMNSYW